MNIPRILKNIPFFSSLTSKEIQSLCIPAVSRKVKKGEKIDLKKNRFFGLITDGMFENMQRINTEGLYILPGSFFGEAPFTTLKQAGSISAVTNSEVLLLDPADMYRSLLLSYKGLKGYIRNIKRTGFEINATGNEFLKSESKVITFFSPYHNSGTTTLAAIAGLLLSKSANTIILDASHNGSSLFKLFDKEMPSAVSQKKEVSPEDISQDKFIYDRVVNAGDNLSLLNISAGSRIKVNPDILSPIIFLLSRKYKYIIIDHSDYINSFTNSILGMCDIVFPVMKSLKDKSAVYAILDLALKDGQRVYYILNRYFAKNVGIFEGGYMFEDLDIPKKEKNIQNLKNKIDGSKKQNLFGIMTGLINEEKTGLVVQTNLINSFFLSGFFSLLYEQNVKISMMHSSSWSFLICALFVLSKDQKEFESNVNRLFSESRINSYLEVTFPEEFVYKKNKIFNFISELAADRRLEHYNVLPAAMLTDKESGESRIFSTGYVRDIFTASFALDIFEPQRIANSFFHSGFPACFVRPENLMRTDIKNIQSICVNNGQKLPDSDKKISGFFRGYVNSLEEIFRNDLYSKFDTDYAINVNVEKYNIKEILKISKEICKDFKYS